MRARDILDYIDLSGYGAPMNLPVTAELHIMPYSHFIIKVRKGILKKRPNKITLTDWPEQYDKEELNDFIKILADAGVSSIKIVVVEKSESYVRELIAEMQKTFRQLHYNPELYPVCNKTFKEQLHEELGLRSYFRVFGSIIAPRAVVSLAPVNNLVETLEGRLAAATLSSSAFDDKSHRKGSKKVDPAKYGALAAMKKTG